MEAIEWWNTVTNKTKLLNKYFPKMPKNVAPTGREILFIYRKEKV